MKLKYFISLLAMFGLIQTASASQLTEIMRAELQLSIAKELQTKNLIEWKVGEYSKYKIGMQGFELGTMHKFVDREEGNAIWMVQEVSGMMSQKSETLIDRATGQMLRLIENGQEKEPPENNLEIISQDEDTVTVPAGTFDAIHIVAKSPDIEKIELWANPRDVNMDGSIQTAITSNGMPIMIQLTEFGDR